MDAAAPIFERLAKGETATRAAVGDWLIHADDPAGDGAERITLRELNELREHLAQRDAREETGTTSAHVT